MRPCRSPRTADSARQDARLRPFEGYRSVRPQSRSFQSRQFLRRPSTGRNIPVPAGRASCRRRDPSATGATGRTASDQNPVKLAACRQFGLVPLSTCPRAMRKDACSPTMAARWPPEQVRGADRAGRKGTLAMRIDPPFLRRRSRWRRHSRTQHGADAMGQPASRTAPLPRSVQAFRPGDVARAGASGGDREGA